MEKEFIKLGNSGAEQETLRAITLWAADCADKALPVFEREYPRDSRPRDAIIAGRQYGEGKPRDKNLRVVAMAAFKLGKDVNESSKFVTKSAQLVAALAYTHTDLQEGEQGIRQAKHILGPAVYAAMAIEKAAGNDSKVGDELIQSFANAAPTEIAIINYFPSQPESDARVGELFYVLDSLLRIKFPLG